MKIKTIITKILDVIEKPILEGIIYIAIKITIFKIKRKEIKNDKNNKKK